MFKEENRSGERRIMNQSLVHEPPLLLVPLHVLVWGRRVAPFPLMSLATEQRLLYLRQVNETDLAPLVLARLEDHYR